MSASADVIGVIGLGVMGSAMSRHIVAGGYDVRGYDIDSDKAASFDGQAMTSVADVARTCDIVLLSLPTPSALRDVSDAIAAVGREGLIVVEMGTLSLDDKLEARDLLTPSGVVMLDAPVSGTGLQAADASLVVYCSGPTPVYERARPVFDLIATRTFDLGEFGNGTRMKFVANLLVAVHTLATAEAHALGAAAGLDADELQKVIGAGVGSSRIFDIRGPMIASTSYEPPSARLAIIAKDAGLISEFARGVGACTPLLDAAIPLYQRGIGEQLGDLDAAALRLLLPPDAADRAGERGQI